MWSLQQDWKISKDLSFASVEIDKNCWLTLPRWKRLCHSLARDQPQPGSFFQQPREAEKRDPGNEVGSVSEHTSKSVNFTVYKCFSSHFPLQKPPGWHHKARMVGRGKLLKETRGERWFDSDWKAKTIRMETWRFMSEVVSLAVLWVDSKTYRGNLDKFWLPKNAIGAIFCR